MKKLLPSKLSLLPIVMALSACGDGSSPTHANNTAASQASTPAAATTTTASAPVSSIKPTTSLLERIQNKGTIIVATEGDYAPFSYHEKETNKLTGYDVEVARLVAVKLGVQIEFRELKWVGILPGVEVGEFDMAANQISLSSPERQAKFDKSEPYSWSGISILTRADDNRIKKYEDIHSLRAAQSATSSYGERATKAGAILRYSESMYQSANLVKLKEADLTINDTLAIMHYLKTNNADNQMKIAWTSPKQDKKGAGIVLLKGNDPIILEKVNQAIKELKADGTLQRLGEQFFGVDVSEP